MTITIPTVDGDRRWLTHAVYIGPDPDNAGHYLVRTIRPVHGEYLHSLTADDIMIGL